MPFIQFLVIPPEYEFSRIMAAVLLLALAVISTCFNHKLRKMEKQNEELNRRVKEQEAELTRLKQQKNEAGKEPE